ncbi:MAG: branched-chain amino acid ABC transporter permease [Xanthobacteraceae bacterium]
MNGFDVTWTMVAQAIVSGVLTGGVYGFLAIGLSLCFGVMRILNFAHGDLVMYGMYAGSLASAAGIDPLLILPASFMFTALVGIGQCQLVFRHFVGIASLKQLLAAIGCALVLQMIVRSVFGPGTRTATSIFSDRYFLIGGLFVPVAVIAAFVIAAALTIATTVVLRGSRWGKAVRAIADDMEAAEIVGIHAARVNVTAFALACGLAGVAGTVLVTYVPAQPSSGFALMPIILIATVIGGLGSVGGTFLGGIFCGLVQQLTGLVWNSAPANIPLYVLLFVFIAFRPTGFFGRRVE